MSDAKVILFTVAYHQMIDHIRKNKRISLKEEFKEDARGTAIHHSMMLKGY